jgi:NADH:ubiquinone oxidoreductase subunit 5 (subunit L)/multisubunit Na+/H+ antiporter MnhA subunit
MKYEALPWLILFLPLFAAAGITLFTLRWRNVSALLSIGAIVTGFVLTVVFITNNGWTSVEFTTNWLTIGTLSVDFGLKLDRLSLMMMMQPGQLMLDYGIARFRARSPGY